MVDAFEAAESPALQFGQPPSPPLPPLLPSPPPNHLFICPATTLFSSVGTSGWHYIHWSKVQLKCSRVVTLHLLKRGRSPELRRRHIHPSCNLHCRTEGTAQLLLHSNAWVCRLSKSGSLLLAKSCQERDIRGRVTRVSKPPSQESFFFGIQNIQHPRSPEALVPKNETRVLKLGRIMCKLNP